MTIYRVIGGTPLNGTIRIAGRKNAALPVIAATLLTRGAVTVKNLPDISDANLMIRILEDLGSTVATHDDTTIFDSTTVKQTTLPTDATHQLRGSVLFLGPLVARLGECQMPHPGGCIIGKRPVGLHFDVMRQLGATVKSTRDHYHVRARSLHGATIFLHDASVTGTENALMAAAVAHGTTTLMNAATEDHVGQLASLLVAMGYKIEGIGTSTLTIKGSGGKISDTDVTVTIIPDELELGTLITAAVVTKGDVTMTHVGSNAQTLPIRAIFEWFGVNLIYNEKSETLRVKGPHHLRPQYVKTGTWPGIPTDLQPPLALLATQIDGNTMIHDWMYEGRFSYVANLSKMGADIITCDPHRILVHGITPLNGTKTTSPDLRAGATQLIGALAAKGESIIDHAEIIERGYEHIVERLTSLKASVERLEG